MAYIKYFFFCFERVRRGGCERKEYKKENKYFFCSYGYITFVRVVGRESGEGKGQKSVKFIYFLI